MSSVETLKTNSDFRRAYARGRSYTNPALVMYVRKTRAGSCRIGITASKKIGNAVQRNRARRVIREAFRQIKLPLKSGFDIVFVARTKTVFKKSTDIYEIMLPMMREAGVFINEERSS